MNTDIIDNIIRIREAFLMVNMEPPTAILLKSHEEGMRFLSAVRQQDRWIAIPGSPDFGHSVKMADGSIWMELKVMGIAVRWPANKTARSDGLWCYT